MKDENRSTEQIMNELAELRRKVVELEAREPGTEGTDELYRILAEKSFAGVYVVQDGIFQFLNSNAAAYVGYTPGDLIGKTSISIVHREDRETARKNAVKMLKGDRTFPYKFRITTKDDSTRWIMETVTSIDYKGKPAVLGNSMDITEKIATEESLRRSEQLYADIINFLPDATLVIDIEGRVVAWNRAIEEMTGVMAKDMLGKGNYEYAIPFYGVRRPILIDLVFESDEEIEQKYHFISREKDCLIVETDAPFVKGQNLFLWGKASPIYDYQGNIIGAIESIRDLTDRKRAEEALQLSEEKYRTLIESTLDLVFIVDRGGLYSYVNPTFERVTGYAASELIGRAFTYIIAPEQVKLTIDRFKKGLKGESASAYESDLVNKNGERIPVEFLVTTLFDTKGQPIGRFGIARDITERKQAEDAIRKAEREKALVLDTMSEIVFYLDTDLKVLWANNNAFNLFNLFPDQLTEKICYEAIHQRTKPCSVCPVVKAFETGMPQETEVVSSYGKNWILRAYPVRDKSGSITGVVEVVTDVTELTRAEEEKRKLETRLQQAQKMEAIGTLAGGIAHDFNNLLMGMLGNVSLMLQDTDPGYPNYKKLKTIEHHIQSGAELTRQLLGFARGGKYEVEPTDLNSLVRKTSEMFGRTKKEVTIREKYQKDIWTVEVDQGQMKRVLLNLYLNASEAMPGGGELYLQTENVTLDKKYAIMHNIEPGIYVKISVTDTGKGMDQATKEKIFDPFFTTRKMGSVKGTGLGLASAYGIIKNHGGIINVDSGEGVGSTFNIYLPASEAVISYQGAEIGEEQLPTGHEAVLFVDDEEMIIDVGKEMLKKLGYEVITARGGRESIDIYKENRDRIDIVIMDMIMPEMGGGEAYDRLKEINPDIKVLLSSGYSINGQATEILNRGCNGFIQKPFNLEDLSREIVGILNREYA